MSIENSHLPKVPDFPPQDPIDHETIVNSEGNNVPNTAYELLGGVPGDAQASAKNFKYPSSVGPASAWTEEQNTAFKTILDNDPTFQIDPNDTTFAQRLTEQSALTANAAPAEQDTQTPKHTSFMELVRKHKAASGIAGGLAGLALLIAAEVGINSAPKADNTTETLPPEPTTTASAPVTPGTQESAKPTATEKAKPATYDLNSLKAMSPEVFNKLSNEDKGPYLKFLLSETDKHFEWFIGPSKDLYKFNPLDIAAETNTPEQIAKQLAFEGELVFAQPLNNVVGDFTLNKDTAKKALSAQFYDTTSDQAPALYRQRVSEIDAGAKAIAFSLDLGDAKLVEGLTDNVDHNGKPIKTEIISMTSGGVQYTYQVVFDKLDDKTSIWKLYKELPNK